MKLSDKFLTHNTNGENYMISIGDTKFKGMIKNNDTASFIIECLKEKTTEENIVDRILNEYEGVDRNTVEKDVKNIMEKLYEIGAIED